jgi:hypothetical protein
LKRQYRRKYKNNCFFPVTVKQYGRRSLQFKQLHWIKAMALNLFKKKLRGENKYFDQRSGNDSEAPPKKVEEKYLLSDRMIKKDLISELLKAMKSHDMNASIMVMANTTDNALHKSGIMINKGYMPKKIVSYLQNVSIHEIEQAISIIKKDDPDEDGYYIIDEPTAAKLNLPLGCMILGIIHHMKKEFGVALVLKQNLKDKAKFAKKVKKIICP